MISSVVIITALVRLQTRLWNLRLVVLWKIFGRSRVAEKCACPDQIIGKNIDDKMRKIDENAVKTVENRVHDSDELRSDIASWNGY